MDLVINENVTLTDTDLAKNQARVRGLIALRLEKLWRGCEPFIEARQDEETGAWIKPDPRYLETGARVLRDLGKLWRIEAPLPQDPQEGKVAVPDLEIVSRQLAELEARMRPATS